MAQRQAPLPDILVDWFSTEQRLTLRMRMFRKIATPTTPSASPSAGVVTDTAPCEKSLRLTVRPETIAPIRSAVLAEFQRQAALPGFRKGKAPTALVERQYAQHIQEETL